MAPSGEDSLGVTAVSFSERSIADVSESLTLGIHFKISMWSSYSLWSSLKKKIEVRGLELSWCMIHNDSCPPFLLKCINRPR